MKPALPCLLVSMLAVSCVAPMMSESGEGASRAQTARADELEGRAYPQPTPEVVDDEDARTLIAAAAHSNERGQSLAMVCIRAFTALGRRAISFALEAYDGGNARVNAETAKH